MSCCDQDHSHQQHNEEDPLHHGGNHHEEEVIQGQSEEEKNRLKQLRIERRRQEMLDRKKKYLPLLKFLKNNGLKFKSAAVDKNSVEYFRMDKFRALLQAKKEQIAANNTVSELLRNWEKIFIFYERLENQPHLKYPPFLQRSNLGSKSKFASFSFDSSQSSKFKSILLLSGVIAIVLFPLWPIEVKFFLWYVCYYIAISIVATIFLRLILYMFCSIFGISFWLFPKFFDNVDFVQTFKPIFSINKWQGSNIYSIITRLIILCIFCYYGFHIYKDPAMINQNLEITKTIMSDINDWGMSKIKGEKNFSQSALTDYSKLLNKTIEEQQTYELGEGEGEKIEFDDAFESNQI